MAEWLRVHIGFNHPAGGEDIIVATHFAIFEALLDKDCADGKALREAFGAACHSAPRMSERGHPGAALLEGLKHLEDPKTNGACRSPL